MKVGVVTFPGSNCDYDAYATFRHILNEPVEFLWHQSTDLDRVDLVILPGGFSYGDYLRAGAIARFSPILEAVITFALRFSCKWTHLRVEQTDSPFTSGCTKGDILRIPIAHGDGNYYNFDGDIRELEDNGQVAFRYVTPEGDVTAEANPNGSINNIAGIVNREGNVLGMMPHPERAVETILGSTDGLRIFESIRTSLKTYRMVENG